MKRDGRRGGERAQRRWEGCPRLLFDHPLLASWFYSPASTPTVSAHLLEIRKKSVNPVSISTPSIPPLVSLSFSLPVLFSQCFTHSLDLSFIPRTTVREAEGVPCRHILYECFSINDEVRAAIQVHTGLRPGMFLVQFCFTV